MQPSDLNLATQVVGHQRFLFISLAPSRVVDAELTKAIDALGDGMENMHEVTGNPSEEALRRGRFQFLRAEHAMSREREIPHPALSKADGLIRLEASSVEPFLHYEAQLRMLVEHRGGSVEALAGVQRPRSYTSYAMTQFGYATALPPGPGSRSPFGVVTPLNKTKEWWAMDWMHRESFFLPRYDAQEKLVAKGHALAAASGIPSINRRLVHAPNGYGQEGIYDFIGYFEFAEEHASVFREVMAALRDVKQNPEWAYVREGPEWWGRRVGRAADLWVRS
jgi:hypothetical protein